MNIACFIIGVVFGIVAVIVISCCVVASECDRKEERYEEEHKINKFNDRSNC